jgi:hypothetical protein
MLTREFPRRRQDKGREESDGVRFAARHARALCCADIAARQDRGKDRKKRHRDDEPKEKSRRKDRRSRSRSRSR